MDWHIALAGLLVGTAVGFSGVGGSSLIGSRLCGVLPEKYVRPATVAVMALTGGRML